MRKKEPEFFQSNLDKFAQNIDRAHPRFEPVPPQHKYSNNGNAYWIPLFSVKQKGKARIVFDSAARTGDVCINDKLRQGPDRNNSLRGVIDRFRRHPYAITADVKNMFHQFAVPDEQKTYLRFFWYENNDPNRPIIEYWSKVHLMGLKSSPAIANTGVRFALREHPPTSGSEWIREDDLLDPLHPNATRIQEPTEKTLAEGFYVDDLLTSQPTEEDALHLIQTAISRMQRYDLNLCKVHSNAQLVSQAYPPDEPPPDTINLKERDPTLNEEQTTSLGMQ